MEHDTPSHDYTPTYQISLIYLKRQKSYDWDTKTLKKYQLFDLEVKGQGQNVVMMAHDTLSHDDTLYMPNIIILSEETKKLWPGEIVNLQIHSDLTMS